MICTRKWRPNSRVSKMSGPITLCGSLEMLTLDFPAPAEEVADCMSMPSLFSPGDDQRVSEFKEITRQYSVKQSED